MQVFDFRHKSLFVPKTKQAQPPNRKGILFQGNYSEILDCLILVKIDFCAENQKPAYSFAETYMLVCIYD